MIQIPRERRRTHHAPCFNVICRPKGPLSSAMPVITPPTYGPASAPLHTRARILQATFWSSLIVVLGLALAVVSDDFESNAPPPLPAFRAGASVLRHPHTIKAIKTDEMDDRDYDRCVCTLAYMWGALCKSLMGFPFQY